MVAKRARFGAGTTAFNYDQSFGLGLRSTSSSLIHGIRPSHSSCSQRRHYNISNILIFDV